jgi:hypothetical protein
VLLETEPRTSNGLGKCFTTELHPQSCTTFVDICLPLFSLHTMSQPHWHCNTLFPPIFTWLDLSGDLFFNTVLLYWGTSPDFSMYIPLNFTTEYMITTPPSLKFLSVFENIYLFFLQKVNLMTKRTLSC